jgi:hypothetical protein
MNLLTLLFRLPLLPVRGFVQLGTLIQEEVNREMASPAKIRRELEHAEQARESGQISDEQAADFEQEALSEFGRAQRGTAVTSPGEG